MRLGQQGVAQLLILLIIVGGIMAGVYAVGQRTNLFPRAVSNPISSPTPGPVTEIKLLPPANSITPTASGSAQVQVIRADVAKSDLWLKASGQVANLVPDRAYGLKLCAKGTTNCSAMGSFGSRTDANGATSFSGVQLTYPFGVPANLTDFTIIVVHSPVFGVPTTSQCLNATNPCLIGNYSLPVSVPTPTATASAVPTATPVPTSTSVPTPTPDPDSDGDGWTNLQERLIGTDPFDACPDNKRDAAWPPDLNNDRKVNNGDNGVLSNHIRKKRTYTARYDLNTNGQVDSADQTLLRRYLGKSCNN